MKFTINLGNNTLLHIMRTCGYAPENPDEKTGQHKFHRFLTGRPFPRFHVYCKQLDEDQIQLNLHLDQKRPSYEGSRAHSGEYEGGLIEAEVDRMIRLAEKAKPFSP